MTDNLSRGYGLIKIHKPGYPLTVIVSSINSPLYFLSLFLHNIIVNSIPEASSYIKRNGFHLIEKLNGTHFDSNYILISLDSSVLVH